MASISFRDVHGIADELGVDVQTVRRWIQSGRLRAFKPGKEYRVREADLEEFLAAREVRPKGSAPSPLEPSLFNGLEGERRDSILAGAVAAATDAWLGRVADPATDSDTAWGIVKAAQDLENHLSILLGAHAADDFSGEALRQIARAMKVLEDVEARYGVRLEAELQRGAAPPDQLAVRRRRKEELNERKASRTA